MRSCARVGPHPTRSVSDVPPPALHARVTHLQVAQRARGALEWTYDELKRRLSDVPGFSVEDNVLCISAHYRRVPSEHHAHVTAVVDDVLDDVMKLRTSASDADALSERATSMSIAGSDCGDSSTAGLYATGGTVSAHVSTDHLPMAASEPAPGASSHTSSPQQLDRRSALPPSVPLCRREGKMVHELRPKVEWDKGAAVRWLYEQMLARVRAELPSPAAHEADAEPELLPVYVGDDVADEDGFAAVRALHPRAIAVKVTARDLAPGAPEPRATMAQYALEDPQQVAAFLRHLADV